MHARLGIALAIAITWPSLVAAADPGEDATAPPPPDPPVAEVAVKPPPSTPRPILEPAKFTWVPYGYLRMQYRFIQSDPTVAFIGHDAGFELQNARLGVTGTLLGDRAAYAIAFDGAVDERAQINTPDGKLRVGLKDAWVDVGVAGRTAIRGGYFLSWVDPEAQIADTARELVDRPIESRGIRATEGYQTQGLPPGRSLGVALRVDQHPGQPSAPGVGFELALQNGADEYSSNNDNNLPAVSAAGIVRLPGHGFIVGAVRFNPRTVGELPARRDENDVQGSIGFHVLAGPVSFGAGGVITHTTFPTTGGPNQNAFGGHAQIMYGPTPTFAFGYRFGVLDPSSLLVTDRVMEHTLGATLAVPELHMRVQLQLTHVAEQAERTLDNDRVQLAAEVSL